MTHAINILYFGALGEQLGQRAESLLLPQENCSIAQLRQQLICRGESWRALSAGNLCMAANHAIVNENYVIRAGDEIAFFPPVTGG